MRKIIAGKTLQFSTDKHIQKILLHRLLIVYFFPPLPHSPPSVGPVSPISFYCVRIFNNDECCKMFLKYTQNETKD